MAGELAKKAGDGERERYERRRVACNAATRNNTNYVISGDVVLSFFI